MRMKLSQHLVAANVSNLVAKWLWAKVCVVASSGIVRGPNSARVHVEMGQSNISGMKYRERLISMGAIVMKLTR
jgi:hypothetical protein